MKKEFTFTSCDRKTPIHVIMWMPQIPIRAILQISHGMVEYIERYDEFATFLSQRGYLVVGHDHLGHGASALTCEEHGYFEKKHGNEIVIGDIRKLYHIMKKQFPDVPYFMLGHSMGSFLLRQYIQMYGKDLSGAVIMGTGSHSAATALSGMVLCKMLSLLKGDHYRSQTVNNLAFGSYNRRFQPSRTSYDWLTKDTTIVDKYAAHPWCTFTFTVNAYFHMFRGLLTLTSKKNRNQIPKDLPLFLVSGADDPVGNFGKSVKHVLRQYKKAKIQDVSMKLYPKDRHEILNELDRETVYQDIFEWLEKHMDSPLFPLS